MTLEHFLNMGGYAVYVWPSYGLTLFLLVYNWWHARSRVRKLEAMARQRAAQEEGR